MLARSDRAGRERDASDVESAERGAEARADLAAENVRLRHLAVFEYELARVRATQPHLVVDLADPETLETLFDDEPGDAPTRRLCAVR